MQRVFFCWKDTSHYFGYTKKNMVEYTKKKQKRKTERKMNRNLHFGGLKPRGGGVKGCLGKLQRP